MRAVLAQGAMDSGGNKFGAGGCAQVSMPRVKGQLYPQGPWRKKRLKVNRSRDLVRPLSSGVPGPILDLLTWGLLHPSHSCPKALLTSVAYQSLSPFCRAKAAEPAVSGGLQGRISMETGQGPSIAGTSQPLHAPGLTLRSLCPAPS